MGQLLLTWPLLTWQAPLLAQQPLRTQLPGALVPIQQVEAEAEAEMGRQG